MQWRAQREKTWSRHTHQFIALTHFARELFVKGGLPADRISIKPNFVVDPGQPLSSEPRMGGLFVGRLSAEKGAETLIEAWRALPNKRLDVVGDGPDRARLEAIASPNVRFLGQLPSNEVRTRMRQAEFLAMPSVWYEGFPMTVVEAFSTGLPVIASRLGALQEIIQDGVNGRLFEPGNSADLANVIVSAIESNQFQQLGRAARATYSQHYTPRSNLSELEKIYSAALIQSTLPNTEQSTANH
jgi:glycosyltransferase involved in cell wall biosynthesis